MQRTLLGIFSATLLLGGLGILAFAPDNSNFIAITGAMIRVGLVLTAIWLALPNLLVVFARFPPWLIGATALSVVIVAWRPTTLLVVGPILAIMWALGPNWFGRTRK